MSFLATAPCNIATRASAQRRCGRWQRWISHEDSAARSEACVVHHARNPSKTTVWNSLQRTALLDGQLRPTVPLLPGRLRRLPDATTFPTVCPRRTYAVRRTPPRVQPSPIARPQNGSSEISPVKDRDGDRGRILAFEDPGQMLARNEEVRAAILQRSQELDALKQKIQHLELEKQDVIKVHKKQLDDLASKRDLAVANLKDLKLNADLLVERAVSEITTQRDNAHKELEALNMKLDAEVEKRSQMLKEVNRRLDIAKEDVSRRDQEAATMQAKLDAAKIAYKNVRETTKAEVRPILRREVVATYKKEFDNLRNELEEAKSRCLELTEQTAAQRHRLLEELAQERALRNQKPVNSPQEQSVASRVTYESHRELYNSLARDSFHPAVEHADMLLQDAGSAHRAFSRRPSVHHEMDRRVQDFAGRYPQLYQSLESLHRDSKLPIDLERLFNAVERLRQREQEFGQAAHDTRMLSRSTRFEATDSLAHNAAIKHKVENTVGPTAQLRELTAELRRLGAQQQVFGTTATWANLVRTADIRRMMPYYNNLLILHELVAEKEQARLMQFESMAEKRAFVLDANDATIQELKASGKLANRTNKETKYLYYILLGIQKKVSATRRKRIDLEYELGLYTQADDNALDREIEAILAKRTEACERFFRRHSEGYSTNSEEQRRKAPKFAKLPAASSQTLLKRKRRPSLASTEPWDTKGDSGRFKAKTGISTASAAHTKSSNLLVGSAGPCSRLRKSELGAAKPERAKGSKRASIGAPFHPSSVLKMPYLLPEDHQKVTSNIPPLFAQPDRVLEGEPDKDKLNIAHDAAVSPPDMTASLTYLRQTLAVESPEFWSHKLYRNANGEAPAVHYCTTFEQAEHQARRFLDASVVGFDMEWELGIKIDPSSIKTNVSLVQLAAEDKIGLFHIALFKGQTVEELMPPSLRAVLESSSIAKVGVNVQGDARRLRVCLDVDVNGLFELSHMYRIVKYSEVEPNKVNRALVNIAAQTQDVFGLPLKKDEVRTSSWSKRLNYAQTEYAAADAYAGLRLYHALDETRESMQPPPPRPAYYEHFRPLVLGNGHAIEYKPTKKTSVSPDSQGELVEASSVEEYSDVQEELTSSGALVSDHDGSQTLHQSSTSSSSPLKTSASSPVPAAPGKGKVVTSPTQIQNSTLRSSTDPPHGPTLRPSSPQLEEARLWITEWRASMPSKGNIRVSDRHLEIWHLWHHQGLELKHIASLAREPPLSLATVASYIFTAIKEESLPFSSNRIEEPFKLLPIAVHGLYRKILEKARAS